MLSRKEVQLDLQEQNERDMVLQLECMEMRGKEPEIGKKK